jgi:hypothetical protein
VTSLTFKKKKKRIQKKKNNAELTFESHLSTTQLTLGHLITLLASGDGIPRNARSGREF